MARGVRRISAITGDAALRALENERRLNERVVELESAMKARTDTTVEQRANALRCAAHFSSILSIDPV